MPGAAGAVVRYASAALYYPLVLLAGLAPWSAFLGLAGWYGLGRRARADDGAAAAGLPLPVVLGRGLPRLLHLRRDQAAELRPAAVRAGGAAGRPLPGALAARRRRAEPLAAARRPARLRAGRRRRGGRAADRRRGAGAVAGQGTALARRRGLGGGGCAAGGGGGRGVVADPPAAARAGAGGARHGGGRLPRRSWRGGAWPRWTPARRRGRWCRRCSATRPSAKSASAATATSSPAWSSTRAGTFSFWTTTTEVLEQLRYPVEVYLFLPAAEWERLQPLVRTPCRLVGRHRDLYRKCDVVVVTNR